MKERTPRTVNVVTVEKHMFRAAVLVSKATNGLCFYLLSNDGLENGSSLSSTFV